MWWRFLGRLWTVIAYLLLRFMVLVAKNYPDNQPSNCFLWAMKEMESNEGKGELRLVNSAYGPWYHCRYERPNGEVWEFNPPSKQAVWTTPCRQRWQGWISFFKTFPPLIFRGKPYKVN